MWNMFHNYHGKIDLNFAKMIWRFPGEPPLHPLKGRHPTICNLCNAWVGIVLPNDGDEGEIYICTGPAGRIAYPSSNECQYYQIAGTHSFYKLTLTSSPAKVVSATRDEAKSYIAEAYQKLMWLSFDDTRYVALNDLYSLANAEYYEGINAYNKGVLASGDETLLYFSKAATAFTKSQAHAKQLYNTLVPPSTRPSELGLRKLYGEWGTWAAWEFYLDIVNACMSNFLLDLII